MDPLPTELWSPRVTIDQSLGDFVRRTCELTICIGSLQGAIYNLTWYEGTIKNDMDLHTFPMDTDTVTISFSASECYKKNGGVDVNYKTDYRLLFDGWFADCAPTVAPYGWQLVSTVVEPVRKEDSQDDYESMRMELMIASPGGIFGAYPQRSVQEFRSFYAFGSGAEFALGAMSAACDRVDDAEALARIGVETAARFDVSTELPMTLRTIRPATASPAAPCGLRSCAPACASAHRSGAGGPRRSRPRLRHDLGRIDRS